VLEIVPPLSPVLLSLKKSVATMTIDKMNIESQDGRAFIDGAIWVGKGSAASDLTSHWSALKIDKQSCK